MTSAKTYLLMTALQAARFRDETAQDENRLDPIQIHTGPHAGKFALPRRVMDDPAFADRQDAFLMLGYDLPLDAEVFVDPNAEET